MGSAWLPPPAFLGAGVSTPAYIWTPLASRPGRRPYPVCPRALAGTLPCLVDPQNHEATTPESQSFLLTSPQLQAHPCNPFPHCSSVVHLKHRSRHIMPLL